MPEAVFWDTAAFIALGNADDNLHDLAVGVSKSLASQEAKAVTTSAVLTEVANTFSKADTRPIALRLVQAVSESAQEGAATVVHVDSTLWQRGWDLYGTARTKIGDSLTASASRPCKTRASCVHSLPIITSNRQGLSV